MPQDPPKTLPADFNFGGDGPPKKLPANFFDLQHAGKSPKLDTSPEAGERLLGGIIGAIPTVAAIGASAFTGGLSIPAAMGTLAGVGAGSKAVEEGLRAATGIGAPKSFGEAAKNVAVEGLVQGGTEGALRGAGKILEHAIGRYFDPERLYQGALKPSGVTEETAGRRVATGLSEKIVLGKDAPAVAHQRWAQLNKDVEGIIQSSPADIPASQWVGNITKKLDVLRAKWGKVAGQGQQFVKQIDDMERQMLIENGNVPNIVQNVGGKMTLLTPEEQTLAQLRAGAQDLSAKDAQAIKKSTYEAIRTRSGTAYEPGVHPALQTRSQQDIARALKEELEQIYPQIHDMNAREGDLIGLEKELQRFVKRTMNHQSTPYFIFPAVGAMVGAAAGGAEGAGIGGAGALAAHLLRNALEDPAIKSRIAIMLKNAGPGARTAWRLGKELPQAGVRAGEYTVEQSQR